MQELRLIFLSFFLYSCSEDCEGIDCLSEDSFSFTIKSEDTGNDLLFGDEPQISQEELEVFYFFEGKKETAFIKVQSDRVFVPLNREVDEYYVKALDKTDTINVQFIRTDASKCCPSTTEIEEIRVNENELINEPWEGIKLYR